MSTTSVTISRRGLAAILSRLVPDRVAIYPAGICRSRDNTTFLVHSLDLTSAAILQYPARLIVGSVRHQEAMQECLSHLIPDEALEMPTAAICLGIGAARGWAGGLAKNTSSIETLHDLRVVAGALPEVRIGATESRTLKIDPLLAETFSRTIGALGERAFARIAELKVLVVGCGRSGSLVASALARSGVSRLSIVDPDSMELHNLGEMDGVSLRDAGNSKALSISRAIRRDLLRTDSRIAGIVGTATSLTSSEAIRETDVLFSCVDNGAARLSVAILAALYLKPHFDVGTGVLGPGAARRMGADIRLALPGRCLSCFGGVGDVKDAARNLAIVGQKVIRPDWRVERAGSLRSLNMIAAGTAMRMFEDFVAGNAEEPAWLSIDYEGALRCERRFPEPIPDCPVCALAGLGDAGLSLIPKLLRTQDQNEYSFLKENEKYAAARRNQFGRGNDAR